MDLKLSGVLVIRIKFLLLGSAILTRFRSLGFLTILCAETVSWCDATVPGRQDEIAAKQERKSIQAVSCQTGKLATNQTLLSDKSVQLPDRSAKMPTPG